MGLLPEGRHGICHGCTDISRVKFCVPGVKFSCEHVLFLVKSLHMALLCCFGNFVVLKEVNAELLPGSEKDPSAINKVIDTGRLMLSADTVGASQVMLDKSVAYSLERKQFGRAIGSFQAVKHMCAEMTAELEPCHSMVWHAAHCQDNIEEEAREMACHLKAHVAEVGQQVSKTSIEVHGGMGFTWEFDCHLYYRRCRQLAANIGSQAIWKDKLISSLERANQI